VHVELAVINYCNIRACGRFGFKEELDDKILELEYTYLYYHKPIL
jgi:hypothetical protein